MTKIYMRFVSLAGLLVVVAIVSCCVPHPAPDPVVEPRDEIVKCLHPEVERIKVCLDSCAQFSDAEEKGTCADGCCMKVNKVEGTEQDRDALRKCFPECRAAELQGGQQSHGGNP